MNRKSADFEALMRKVAQLTPQQEGPATEEAVPKAIGRYTQLELIGKGGMGVVFGGIDPEDGSEVALKVVREGVMSDEGVHRLEREANVLAAVQHDNLVRFREFGREDKRVYMVMERVRGTTMGWWLRARPTLSAVHEAFCAAGDGLAAAHAAGFVHRDFKPGNVLWGVPGGPKVADFGLTKYVGDDPERGFETLTMTGTWMGTPAYMAPEQFGAGSIDQRCDVFAFSVAVWEAMSGRHPFPDADGQAPRSFPQMVARLSSARAPRWPSRLPSNLGHALAQGLALPLEDRFQSMNALLHALRASAP